jgi:DNA-binding MarR family transcriptional regulator/DNA-binding response OmpR family regulator
MPQANFAYEEVEQSRFGGATVAVFAQTPDVTATLSEDVADAGARLASFDLYAPDLQLPADVVVLDCPRLDAATMAALARLDMQAASAGAQLVVSTSMAALDDVFGCLDQANVQILVEPTRCERVIALGRALLKGPRMQVRELSDDDRLTLLRLTEQVGEIASQLDRLAGATDDDEEHGFRFESSTDEFRRESEKRLIAPARAPLPDPRLVRRIIHQRQLRAKYFDGGLFADPAWDILLDLTAARAEYARVSVTSLCIASGVPPTTALRWIAQMTEAGLLERIEDEADKRRAFIALSDRAADAMARYFAELGKDAKRLV